MQRRGLCTERSVSAHVMRVGRPRRIGTRDSPSPWHLHLRRPCCQTDMRAAAEAKLLRRCFEGVRIIVRIASVQAARAVRATLRAPWPASSASSARWLPPGVAPPSSDSSSELPRPVHASSSSLSLLSAAEANACTALRLLPRATSAAAGKQGAELLPRTGKFKSIRPAFAAAASLRFEACRVSPGEF